MNRIVGLALTVVLCLAATAFASAGGAEEGVVQSATGSGNFFTDAGPLREFTFAIYKYADGSVQGEAHVHNPTLGTLRDFRIDCLSIRDGNLAIASGIVTSAETPSLVGAKAIFAVQDNGEGAHSQPDQVSDGVFLNRGLTCDTAPTALALSVLTQVDAGNVQVRGG